MPTRRDNNQPAAPRFSITRLRPTLFLRCLISVLALLLVIVSGNALHAAGPVPEIRVEVAEGELVTLPRAASTIFVAEPAIADIQTPSTSKIFVFGKKPGRTTLFALDDSGDKIAEYHVLVAFSDSDLQTLLQAEVGNFPVSLTQTPKGAVLSGTVPNAEIAERVRSIAASFLGDGVVLLNHLTVAASLQVTLHVRIAEISRDLSETLGINWSAVGEVGNFAFGMTNPAGFVASGAGSLFASGSSGSFSIDAMIDALDDEGLISILAEPTLTAISGEEASFLAGGEFPIPISQGDDRISVEFRRFGVSLEFVPTVMSNDMIAIHVRPEVSELSELGAVEINGINIPSLTTRTADTTVHLGSGQSFAIAGLIQDTTRANLKKFPGLGDLPILGALFRSTQYQERQTELVIIVTPYITDPASHSGKLQTPTGVASPLSEVEVILEDEIASDSDDPDAFRQQLGDRRLKGDSGFILD